jgi:hypothetical protein
MEQIPTYYINTRTSTQRLANLLLLLPALLLPSRRAGFDQCSSCPGRREAGQARLVWLYEGRRYWYSFGKVAASSRHTGQLAVVLLVVTSTHMDLTRITACCPVLRGTRR